PPTICIFPYEDNTSYRALLSFPTRRSSDLSPEEATTARPSSGKTPSSCDGASGSRTPTRHGRPCWLPRIRTSPPPFTSACSTPADRKSTRLNSSHVKNSYAVFCLKKKNHFT